MEALWHDLRDFLKLDLDESALDKLEWRDYGKGVELAKLKKGEDASLVLYRVADGAPRDGFARHRHPGGEAYLVLKGTIADEFGEYPEGSFVWLPPDSTHTPWAEGHTIVLVLWPRGVEL